MSEKNINPCLHHETYDDYVDCDCNFASSHECWQYQQKKIDQLKIKLEKATKALEFYADPDSFDEGCIDLGDRAEKTLKEIRGNK